MGDFWRKLLSRFPFFSQQPRIVLLVVPAFVLAAGIWVVIGLVYFGVMAWLENDHGRQVRDVFDSLLPLFKWRSDLGQFLVQATLGLAAMVIVALVFVLLYNSLLSILGEEED